MAAIALKIDGELKELLQKDGGDDDDGDGDDDDDDGDDLSKATWKGHCWSTPFFLILLMVALVIRDENEMLVLVAVDVVAAAMASSE